YVPRGTRRAQLPCHPRRRSGARGLQAKPVIGLYPWYSAAWFEHYEPPRVYQYDVYFSETTLYDARQNQLVWSGTVQTTPPGHLNKEIKKLVSHARSPGFEPICGPSALKFDCMGCGHWSI